MLANRLVSISITLGVFGAAIFMVGKLKSIHAESVRDKIAGKVLYMEEAYRHD
jgi:hypothetical protein